MIERFKKLVSVKSIVTIVLTVVFAILSLNGLIKSNEFLVIFTTVIGFYFGTQKNKEE